MHFVLHSQFTSAIRVLGSPKSLTAYLHHSAWFSNRLGWLLPTSLC